MVRKGSQDITSNERRRIRRFRDEAAIRQKNRCYYCEGLMLPASDMTSVYRCSAEHLIKVADGGRANEWNIVAAHQQCQQDLN